MVLGSKLILDSAITTRAASVPEQNANDYATEELTTFG